MPTVTTQSEIDELRERLQRLESAAHRAQVRTNQVGAARYLNMSEETLRKYHERGEGPPRARIGRRHWSYSFSDLDKWLATRGEDAAA